MLGLSLQVSTEGCRGPLRSYWQHDGAGGLGMDIQRWEHGAEQKQELVDEAKPGPITHALPMLPLAIKQHHTNHVRCRMFSAICGLPGNRFKVVFAHPVSKSKTFQIAENHQGHWHKVKGVTGNLSFAHGLVGTEQRHIVQTALHLVRAATGDAQLDLVVSVATPMMCIPFDTRHSLDQNMVRSPLCVP